MIESKVIRSYLSTRSTYKNRAKVFVRGNVLSAHELAKGRFSLAMSKLRLLRAASSPNVLIQMAGEEMGEALHLIKYYRGRSPQVVDDSVSQCELPLGV